MKKKVLKFAPLLAIAVLLFTASCEKEIFERQDYNKEIDPPNQERGQNPPR